MIKWHEARHYICKKRIKQKGDVPATPDISNQKQIYEITPALAIYYFAEAAIGFSYFFRISFITKI